MKNSNSTTDKGITMEQATREEILLQLGTTIQTKSKVMQITKTRIEGRIENANMFNVAGTPWMLCDYADYDDMLIEAEYWKSIGCQIVNQTKDRFLVANEIGALIYLIDLVES